MENKNILDIATRLCFATLLFFMLMIVARFLTRQLLVEKLSWDNLFTKIVFWGDENMGNTPNLEDENGDISVEVDWESKYPFAYSDND